MAKKSLIIHDLDKVDLKYLPTIVDIITISTEGTEDDYSVSDIFNAAGAFIASLSIYEYDPKNEKDRQAIDKFIEATEALLGDLKKGITS